MKQIDIDELIITILSGNADIRECILLNDWLSKSRDNRCYFEQMQNIWLLTGLVSNVSIVDVRIKYKKWTDKVQPQKKSPKHSAKGNIAIKLQIIHVAALIIVAFMAGIFTYRHYIDKQPEKEMTYAYYETIVPFGSQSQVVLTDGTKVWLNAGSKLRYATTFAVSDREVRLEGEGYFEVAKNKKLPFEVKTSKLNIKAIGTTFNVKAYPNDSVIETILVEGHVEVTRTSASAQNEPAVSLKPKQRLTLLKSTDEILFEVKPKSEKVTMLVSQPLQKNMISSSITNIKEVPADTDYMLNTSWKDQRWRIESEELVSLAAKLERRYNVRVTFADEQLKRYRFNGTLENEPVEAVLRAMAQTAPVKFELSGSEVVLSRNDKFSEEYKKLYNNKNKEN